MAAMQVRRIRGLENQMEISAYSQPKKWIVKSLKRLKCHLSLETADSNFFEKVTASDDELLILLLEIQGLNFQSV